MDNKHLDITVNTHEKTSMTVHQWGLRPFENDPVEPERVAVERDGFVYSFVFKEDGSHPFVEIWSSDENDEPLEPVAEMDLNQIDG